MSRSRGAFTNPFDAPPLRLSRGGPPRRENCRCRQPGTGDSVLLSGELQHAAGYRSAFRRNPIILSRHRYVDSSVRIQCFDPPAAQ